MFRLDVNGFDLNIDFFTFNGGEEHVKVQEWKSPVNKNPNVTVYAYIKSSKDLMRLMLLSDAVDRTYSPSNKVLIMPYLPYARQDRVCNKGEALSVKVVANMINSLGYDKVIITDCHSDVGVALLNNCVNRDATPTVGTYDVLVAPDAGASKKILKLAKTIGIRKVLQGHKIRDVSTGQITSTKVDWNSNYNGKFLVVDDICDGGRTFVELAKVIREMYLSVDELSLYVTHGIFSKGKEELLKHYDSVHAMYDWTDNE